LFIEFCFAAAAGYSRKATTVESGKRSKQMAHETPGTPTFYVYVVVIIGLVLFAGLMSGLTLGLMSLGLVDLEVLIKSGTPADKKHAGLLSSRSPHFLRVSLSVNTRPMSFVISLSPCS